MATTSPEAKGQEPVDTRTDSSHIPQADDLLLRDVDGKYYWLKKDEYQKFDVQAQITDEDERRKILNQLGGLKLQGVIVADIPSSSIQVIGCACYLVDLGAIRRASTKLQRGPGPA